MPEFLSEEANLVIEHEGSVFDGHELAAQWLRTPNRVLEGRTPLELLAMKAREARRYCAGPDRVGIYS